MSHPVYGDGTTTEQNARTIITAVWGEFPALHAVFATLEEAEAKAEELLLRIIWHLHQAGYFVGRQKNPSGLISKDKLTIMIAGAPGVWQWVDIFTLGSAGKATTLAIQAFTVTGAQHISEPGIADGAQPAPEPVPQPPSNGTPYDEGFYTGTVGPQMMADYTEAGRHVGDDDQWIVWPARCEFDTQHGFTRVASWKKHRNEMRVALGLKPLP